ncbi:hypothetical protein [Timonella sp. A28]|uniref:hypothetical protein n=1 Tax=Timonella sp. A28 TaxID=3442640 RepID=UPI003EBFEDBB
MPTETPEPQRPEQPPAAPQGKKRTHRRVVRQGTEREAIFGVSTDEKDDAQSNTSTDNGNDERLLRDVPPHWGR